MILAFFFSFGKKKNSDLFKMDVPVCNKFLHCIKAYFFVKNRRFLIFKAYTGYVWQHLHNSIKNELFKFTYFLTRLYV